MTVHSNLEEYLDLRVVDFDPEKPGTADWSTQAARVRLTYEHDEKATYTDLYTKFLKEPHLDQLQALIIGMWQLFAEGDGADQIVENVVSTKDRYPALRGFFFGDIVSEENEISWIEQTDVSPIFAAFPNLEDFTVRGGNNLSLGRPAHDKLKSLVVQAGGLPRRVVQEVSQGKLPNLEHLELWLGSDNYGATTTAEDLAPILSGELFPKLTSLAIRNCEWADDLAALVATAKVLERIKSLDLSLGNMGDRGFEALIASPAVAKLEKLDVSHHYASEPVLAKLKGLGPAVTADDPQKPDEWDGREHRYIAVSE